MRTHKEVLLNDKLNKIKAYISSYRRPEKLTEYELKILKDINKILEE